MPGLQSWCHGSLLACGAADPCPTRFQWVLCRDAPSALQGFGFGLAWSVLAVPLMPACFESVENQPLDLDCLGWDSAKVWKWDAVLVSEIVWLRCASLRNLPPSVQRALGDWARHRAIARAENSKKDGVPVFDTGAQGFLTARISLFSGVFGVLAGCVHSVGQPPWTDCCSLWFREMVVFCIWIAAVLRCTVCS